MARHPHLFLQGGAFAIALEMVNLSAPPPLTAVDRTRHVNAWETKMIDLKKELEARLEKAKEIR